MTLLVDTRQLLPHLPCGGFICSTVSPGQLVEEELAHAQALVPGPRGQQGLPLDAIVRSKEQLACSAERLLHQHRLVKAREQRYTEVVEAKDGSIQQAAMDVCRTP